MTPSRLKELVREKYNSFRQGKDFIERSFVIVSSALFLVVALFYGFFVAPPITMFSLNGSIFTITSGDSVLTVAEHLKEGSIIRSSFCFRMAVKILGRDGKIIAGDYYFNRPVNCFGAVARITNGDHGLTPFKVTIPEGLSVPEVGDLFKKKFPNFDSKEFVAMAKIKEGYLFPDTYMFFPNVTPNGVVRVLEANFQNKIQSLQDEI